MNLWLILALTFLSFLNILAPYSGTAIITPILVGITGNAQKAITFGLFYFAMSSTIRVLVFKKYIQWEYIKPILPASIFAAFLGALLSLNIPVVILLFIMICTTVSYLIKKISKSKSNKKEGKFGNIAIGLFTGFLQGTGVVGGSDLRNSYLFSKGLNIQQVGATTAVLGVANFIAAITIRLINGTVSIPEISYLLILLPFVLIATLAGRSVLFKISSTVQDIIIYSVILISLILLLFRLFESIH